MIKYTESFYDEIIKCYEYRPETRQSMEMLFSAKWNLPKAAENCGLTNKEMKITFNEYCRFHLPTWEGDFCECGGIGRRTRLKICWELIPWGFKSPHSH